VSSFDKLIAANLIWIAFNVILIGGLYAPNTLAWKFSCFVFGCQ
jgi:hypothetical protein